MRMEPSSRLKPLLVLNEVMEHRYADLARPRRPRVARYSESTAQELGAAPAAVERLGLAGRLHDLRQGGRVERRCSRSRARSTEGVGAGAQAPGDRGQPLASSNQDDIAEYVLAHHERPTVAAIRTGARTRRYRSRPRSWRWPTRYDAMISERVYRPALPPQEAARELRAGTGTPVRRRRGRGVPARPRLAAAASLLRRNRG